MLWRLFFEFNNIYIYRYKEAPICFEPTHLIFIQWQPLKKVSIL